jgi:hypothetical protein
MAQKWPSHCHAKLKGALGHIALIEHNHTTVRDVGDNGPCTINWCIPGYNMILKGTVAFPGTTLEARLLRGLYS